MEGSLSPVIDAVHEIGPKVCDRILIIPSRCNAFVATFSASLFCHYSETFAQHFCLSASQRKPSTLEMITWKYCAAVTLTCLVSQSCVVFSSCTCKSSMSSATRNSSSICHLYRLFDNCDFECLLTESTNRASESSLRGREFYSHPVHCQCCSSFYLLFIFIFIFISF